MKGLFITFEGGEGCGKTTQIARLREHLVARGLRVEVTREPGGTPVAESIRGLLLDPANTGLSAIAELLLYEAARAQHVAEKIKPALDAGAIVLCDRFADSTTAYQGAGRALPRELVLKLHDVAVDGTWPDLTILLDVPVEEGFRRRDNERARDRMEHEPLVFHEKVREGFLRLAQEEPRRIRLIDGSRSADEVTRDIVAEVDALLGAVR